MTDTLAHDALAAGTAALEGLTGIRRADGRWGFRDHLLVLPTHAAANRVAERIAAASDAVVVRHDWTGGVDDPDHDRAMAVLAGFADHPDRKSVV